MRRALFTSKRGRECIEEDAIYVTEKDATYVAVGDRVCIEKDAIPHYIGDRVIIERDAISLE